jgi:hypothetical protein
MFIKFPYEIRYKISNSYPPLLPKSQRPGSFLNCFFIEDKSQIGSRSLSSLQFPQLNEIPSEKNKENMQSGENENNIENKGIIKYIQGSKGLAINKNVFIKIISMKEKLMTVEKKRKIQILKIQKIVPIQP